MKSYKQLSDWKFANEKIESNMIRFWISASKKEITQFKKTLALIPICAFVDGLFFHIGDRK